MTSVFRGQKSQSADSSRHEAADQPRQNSRDNESSGATSKEEEEEERESFDVPLLKDTDTAPCKI